MSPRYAGFLNVAQYERLNDAEQHGEWRDNALCRGANTELWYPARGEVGDEGVVAAKAKAVCARCPVQAPCLEYALTSGEKFGVWGGMSERQRRKERLRRRLPEPVVDDVDKRLDQLAVQFAAMRLAAAAIQIYGHDSDSGAA